MHFRINIAAAHCLTLLTKDYNITTVRLGEHDLQSESDCELVRINSFKRDHSSLISDICYRRMNVPIQY